MILMMHEEILILENFLFIESKKIKYYDYVDYIKFIKIN
jgi:hypothetical protein